MAMKPRIFRYAGHWVARTSLIDWSHGDTPKQAYDLWKKNRQAIDQVLARARKLNW